MKRFLPVLIMMVLSLTMAWATNIEVDGHISANTTWDVDTVYVIGDVFVDDTYTLTINPGTVVIVNGMYKIDVQGAVIAEGTEADSIKFTAADIQTGWNRFYFDHTPNTNDPSVFSYCIVEYGNPSNNDEITLYKNGGAFFIYYTENITISNSSIRNNDGVNSAIYVDQASATIQDCDISYNNNYGILSISPLTVCKIYNNKIHNNLSAGIYPGYSSATDVVGNVIVENGGFGIACYESVARISNNTIVDNGANGIWFGSNSDNNLYNNLIGGNGDFNILISDTISDPNFYYCDIENGQDSFTGAGSGDEFNGDYDNCIDEDPNFIGTGDHPYAIPRFSQCQDRGYAHAPELMDVNTDAAGNPRISNGFIDIGAYEYYIRTDTVSGVWTAANSPYLITGNQYIANGTTLTIEPGVDVIFQGFYSFTVDGTILAEGTEEDSILFTATDTETGWNRFVFRNVDESNDTSKFDYCTIEYGKPTSYHLYTNNRDGGAFYLYGVPKLNISHCNIHMNQGTNAIIYIERCKVNVIGCKIYDNPNYAILLGGTTDSSRICNNEIFNNSSSGIYSGYDTNAEIVGNVIHSNGGWGVFSYRGYSTYINNTIVDNEDGGINFRASSVANLYNNIIYGNGVTQIQLETTCDPNFYYNNIEGGLAGFTGDGSGAEFTGVYDNNIDEDPSFIDALNFNYALLTGSLCLDAGTPDVSGLNLPDFDFEGNARIINDRIDMGAIEGPHDPVSIDDNPVEFTHTFNLSQNYPNPFNPATTISYEIPKTSQVKITIFNSLGQKMKTLLNEEKSAGEYHVQFNAATLPSGLYFYKIEAGSFTSVKKMVLLK